MYYCCYLLSIYKNRPSLKFWEIHTFQDKTPKERKKRSAITYLSGRNFKSTNWPKNWIKLSTREIKWRVRLLKRCHRFLKAHFLWDISQYSSNKYQTWDTECISLKHHRTYLKPLSSQNNLSSLSSLLLTSNRYCFINSLTGNTSPTYPQQTDGDRDGYQQM